MLLKKSITKHLWISNLFVLFLIVVLGVWIGNVSISGAIVSSGIIIVDSSAKKIQHLAGGIVEKINVRDGDHIKEGDVLIRLNDINAKTNISIISDEVKGYETQLSSKTKEQELINKELKTVRDLYERKLTTTTRLSSLEKEYQRVNSEKAQLESLIKQNKNKITQAQEVMRHIDIKSPSNGIVHQLNVRTIGGVINPGEIIMSIIPENDSLVVEAKIRPEDIDQIKYNQETILKFTAVNTKITPDIKGIVTNISPDIITDSKTNTNYYTSKIVINNDEVGKLGNFKIIPGMNVECFIKTNDRTILSYFVKPITDQMFKSMRER